MDFYLKLCEFLVIAFPFAYLFLIIPSDLYFRNVADFTTKAVVVVWSGFFIVIVSSASLFLYVNTPLTRNILGWLGLFLLLKDILVPLRMKDFKDGLFLHNIEWTKDLGTIEILLLLIIILSSFLFPIDLFKAFVSPILLLMILGPFIQVLKSLPQIKQLIQAKPEDHIGHIQSETENPNVYLITLDSFFGPGLAAYFHERHNQGPFFDGFSFFPNTLSNYNHTHPSVPSFLTGELYIEGKPMKDYRDSWHKKGLLSELKREKYQIWQYVNGNNWLHEQVQHWKTGGKLTSFSLKCSELLNAIILRASPYSLRQKTFKKDGFSGLLGSFSLPKELKKAPLNALPYRSFTLFQDLIAEEKKRPATGQVVHAHFYLPHMPYIFKADGTIGDSDFANQSHFVCRLVEAFLDELRTLDRYKNSTILIQSDHAIKIASGADDLLYQTPIFGEREINEYRPLLLIKRSGAQRTEVDVNDNYAQLCDVTPTLYDLLGLKNSDGLKFEGKNLFYLTPSEEREISIFDGYWRKGQGMMGGEYFKGPLTHHIFNTKTGWRKAPDVLMTWE